MISRRYRHTLLIATMTVAACKCQNQVHNTAAEIEIFEGDGGALSLAHPSLDFGPVRVNTNATQTLLIEAATQQDLTIMAATIVGTDAAAFTIVPPQPATIPGLGQATMTLQFSPTQERAYSATLQIQSNDYRPADQTMSVALTGEGALPHIQLVTGCAGACLPGNCCGGIACADGGTCTYNQCQPCAGSSECGQPSRCAEATPASIDYGLEPAFRTVEPPDNYWPSVTILNEGKLPLQVTAINFMGADANRFLPTQMVNLTQPVVIDSGGGELLYIKFAPCGFDSSGNRMPCPSNPATNLSAQFVVTSDDPAFAQASVALSGELKPEQAPLVCASIVQILPLDGAETAVGWKQPVPVSPFAILTLSAFMDYGAVGGPNPKTLTICTTDPVDGRSVLTYQWTVIAKPPESRAAIGAATNPDITFTPDAAGSYVIQLTATNPEGLSASDTVTFDAFPQKDIGVQLAWSALSVDLDLHVVKPGISSCPPPMGTNLACSPFDECCDASPFVRDHFSYTPQWGNGTPSDTPVISVDALGDSTTGSVESVSLNFPAHDPACIADASACVYQVWVHYHTDNRTVSGAASCSGPACFEGDTCGCPQINGSDAGLGLMDAGNGSDASTVDAGPSVDSGEAMLSDGGPLDAGASGDAGPTVEDSGVPATGPTLCVQNQCCDAPTATIQVYLLSNPAPALEIPIPTDPSGAVIMPGPCFLWHAADVHWTLPSPTALAVTDPDGGPVFAYYGALSGQSRPFICAPNSPPPMPWYEVNGQVPPVGDGGPPAYP
jgi:hypothetical protein